jgi:hypothetical protein
VLCEVFLAKRRREELGVGCPLALSRFIVVSGNDAPEPLAE